MHRAKKVVEKMKELSIVGVMSIPYVPFFNCIELYWNLVKIKFKKMLLDSIINLSDVKVEDLIKQSVNAVSDGQAKKCAEEGIRRIMQ